MQPSLCSVHPDDPVELAAELMDWEAVRHVPVEGPQGEFVGLVTWDNVRQHFASRPLEGARGVELSCAVADIMCRDVYTVSPETTTEEALAMIQRHALGCLPVVVDGQMIALLTESDIRGSSLASRPLRDSGEKH
jgi:CBS domain-containing protein